jgi:hypothetical protein
VLSGDGVNVDKLGDDTEATNWASLDGVAGKRVTVDLAGDAPQLVSRVNVSALLRPQDPADVDGGPQNRFSAVRAFTVSACNAAVSDCSVATNFRQVYRSPSDAFPAGGVPADGTAAEPAHVQLRAGAGHAPAHRGGLQPVHRKPALRGEQDNDPRAATDCTANSAFATHVRIAEFQAFAF